MNFLDNYQKYETTKQTRDAHLKNIETIIRNSNSFFEGNCFYHNGTLNLDPELLPKQLNLFWIASQAPTRICEIGFNAGHSCMLFLLGKPSSCVNFTIFDIGYHPYTLPALHYVANNFKDVQFEYVQGDSTVEMPKWIEGHTDLIGQYDMIHVDGGHTEYCISNDMKNADKLLKLNGYMILDDVFYLHINAETNKYISSGNYKEVYIIPTFGPRHRIIQKIQ
jgi:predicted O-methyltransferase YrrM